MVAELLLREMGNLAKRLISPNPSKPKIKACWITENRFYGTTILKYLWIIYSLIVSSFPSDLLHPDPEGRQREGGQDLDQRRRRETRHLGSQVPWEANQGTQTLNRHRCQRKISQIFFLLILLNPQKLLPQMQKKKNCKSLIIFFLEFQSFLYDFFVNCNFEKRRKENGLKNGLLDREASNVFFLTDQIFRKIKESAFPFISVSIKLL